MSRSDHSRVRAYLKEQEVDFFGVSTSASEDVYLITIATAHPDLLTGRPHQARLAKLRKGLASLLDRSDVVIHVETVDMDGKRDAAQERLQRDTKANTLNCSFCGKAQHQVKKLIAGPGVYICDECIDLCNEIIDEEVPSQAESESPSTKEAKPTMTAPLNAPTDDILKELTTSGDNIRPLEDHVKRLVTVLRARDVTWAQIGEALGMTRQGAWGRFSGEE